MLSGCTVPQQFVYNCTASPIRFSTGYKMGPISYFQTEHGTRLFTVNDYALLPNGTYLQPIRVKEEAVRGSNHESWSEPGNVCGQFNGQVVIVDLR